MKLNDEIREQISIICEKISDGASLRSILKDKQPFSRSTFYEIVSENKDIADQYARAMLERQEALFEEILTIADTTCEGVETTNGPNGIMTKTCDMTAHRRLQIDARKWNLSRMNPKKYGDKIDVNHSGEISEKKITVKYNSDDIDLGT